MKISFEKAPLVEILAELRWGLPSFQPGVPIRVTVASPTTQEEAFFARFAEKIAEKGFTAAERLVPTGFPTVGTQPVYRFKKSPTSVGAPLYQVGTNVFSVHITPPYQSWDEFEPALLFGIEVLLNTRDTDGKPIDFGGSSVRYINAFGEDLMENRSPAEFLSEVLGIAVSLPTALTNVLKPGTFIEPSVRISFSTKGDYHILLNAAKGLINQRFAVIMDTTVSRLSSFPPEKNSAIEVLNGAQKIIHESFIEMTAKIQHLMKPRKEQT